MAAPVPKRRRLDNDLESEHGFRAVSSTQREGEDVRSSLSSLYDDIRVLGDVVVVVQAEMKPDQPPQMRGFPAVSALLASTSRPLHQMLYGAMRSATPSSGDQRPRLVLRDTDPWCFEQMLHFIHGKQICAPRAPKIPRPPAASPAPRHARPVPPSPLTRTANP